MSSTGELVVEEQSKYRKSGKISVEHGVVGFVLPEVFTVWTVTEDG